MKKLIFALVILSLIPMSVYSQRRGRSAWDIKIAGGASSASVSPKMRLFEDASADSGVYEDYKGKWGAEFQIGIKMGRLETNYTLQYYYAEKDGNTTIGGVQMTEVGEISIVNDLIDIGYYIIDDPLFGGLTFSAGVGKGTSKVTVERALAGTKLPDQKHYFNVLYQFYGALHYDILDWLYLKATYRQLYINNVDLASFNNEIISGSVGVMF